MVEPTQQRPAIRLEDAKLVKNDIERLNPQRTAEELTRIVVSLQQLVGGLRNVSRDDLTRANKVEASARKISQIIAYLSGRTAEILRIHDELLQRTPVQPIVTEAQLRQIKETINNLIEDFKKGEEYILDFRRLETIVSKLLNKINPEYDDLKRTLTIIINSSPNVLVYEHGVNKAETRQGELKIHKEALHTKCESIIKKLKPIQLAIGRREQIVEQREIQTIRDVVGLKNTLNEQLTAYLQHYGNQGQQSPHLDEILVIKTQLDTITAQQQYVIRARLATEKDLFTHVRNLQPLFEEFSRMINTVGDNFNSLQQWINTKDSLITQEITQITDDIATKVQELRTEESEIKQVLNMLLDLNNLLKDFQTRLT